jgi:ATP-dependent Clp protease ATP-binding subunit ClpC
MPTARYPVLICRDLAGAHLAVAVDDGTVGFGPSARDATADLRDYLRWLLRKTGTTKGPDFLDAELRWFAVNVRPEYKGTDRVFPAESAVEVRVPVVVGSRASGQPTADLPLLGIRFDYPNRKHLPMLVERYVLQKLEGLTPQELGAYLPPAEVELADVVVSIPREFSTPEVHAKPPRALAQVAEAVGDRAVRKGYARAWGREAEVAALVQKLHREKANVLLVGEPGVGKTTLMVDAVKEAEKLIDEELGKTSRPKPRRFWLTSAGRLVAGMKYLGQWEERVEEVISALGELKGVLCAERLLGLVQRGGVGPADSIAMFLMPYLARGELRMIAEATPAELDACRRLMPGLPDLFQVVQVRPFDRGTALAVIDKQLETSAAGPGVEVERGTGERIVRLFRRFMPYSPFPGLASAFAREIVDLHARDGKKPVTPDAVVDRFRRRTGLPELFLRDEITLKRSEVFGWFTARVIDQPEACETATDVVMTVKAGLNDPNRPPAVLLFCGPTGVGKTHMAQALAQFFFGSGEDSGQGAVGSGQLKTGGPAALSAHSPLSTAHSTRLVRLDMSEYGGFDAVHRLLGPPQGEPGELVKRVRRQPFCVLLLDEVEKAAADVFDTLMGVFDEGRLTDQYGRVTNFRSTVIVMTSNLGAGQSRSVGFNQQSGPRYKDAALRFFRPEFFNRMDRVVTFRSLLPESVKAITKRELDAIARRDGLVRTGVRVEWSDALVDRLAGIGFDSRYGARPLQRAVEREVVAPLARWLLETFVKDGGTIRADWVDGACVFRAG